MAKTVMTAVRPCQVSVLTGSDSLEEETEALFESILSQEDGNIPYADFWVDYALDVCQWRKIFLGLIPDEANKEAVGKRIDSKMKAARKMGINGQKILAVNKMITAKDRMSLEKFYSRLILFTKKKGGNMRTSKNKNLKAATAPQIKRNMQSSASKVHSLFIVMASQETG